MVLRENYIRNVILTELSQTVSSNPTIYDLKYSFDRINQQFFGNNLPMCQFNLQLKKNYLGYFKYDGRSNNNLINPILSVNGMYQYTSNDLDSIVGHEMIHYALALNGTDASCSHGQAFQQMASQMNSALGLNISERVDTSNIPYGMNQQTSFNPSTQLIAFMSSCVGSFNQYAQQMKMETKNANGNVAKFINDFLSFTVALSAALKRCVSKKTLNESGLQTPGFINDFISGYRSWSNSTLNFFDLINRYRNGYGSGGVYYDRNGGLVIDKNTKLFALLYNVFPKMEKEYNKVNTNSFNALNGVVCITNAMQLTQDLTSKIETEIRNAQGQNP